MCKARFKSNMSCEQMLGFMTTATAEKQNVYVLLSGFTTVGAPRLPCFFVL